jgi:hypothetical protein
MNLRNSKSFIFIASLVGHMISAPFTQPRLDSFGCLAWLGFRSSYPFVWSPVRHCQALAKGFSLRQNACPLVNCFLVVHSLATHLPMSHR